MNIYEGDSDKCLEILQYAKKHNIEMPIVNAAYRVLFEGANAKEEVLSLMTRDKKSEADNY